MKIAQTLSKSISRIILATILICGFSVTSNAQSDGRGPFFGKEAPGKWIIGAKLAHVENDADETEDTEGVGIILGYEFARPVGAHGSSTIEFEYISTDDGDIAEGVLGEWDADIYSVFFTYRTAGKLYFKGKVGAQYSSVDINIPGFISTEADDTSLALGLGLGYHVGDLGVVELEYTKDSGDNDIGVVGLNALLEF